jgi:DtxR family Mn-dependent transcriptional regulator
VSDLIDTTEMYLKTIFELEEEGVVALRARIVERLGHSGPTVSQTVARMERDGLLHVLGDRHLELTDAGRSRAVRVMRKHRLAERLLLDVIGLEWEYVHDEACRWEHVMSERVECKLLSLLVDPRETPYGTPIPGLDELGGPLVRITDFRDGVVPLTEAVHGLPTADGPRVLTVRRIGESVQTDAGLLSRLAELGVRPGVGVSAVMKADTLCVQVGRGEVEIPLMVAGHIFVEAESRRSTT